MIYPKFSVCIPSYEANNLGVQFISSNISSVLNQTYQNFEIIVSDHSVNNDIENYINSLKNDKITYIRNGENIGYPSFNTNLAISKSSGDFVKIMNLDDYIESNTFFENCVSLINDGYKWIASSFKHKVIGTDSFFNELVPCTTCKYTDLLKGVNFIGCPSVALIPKNFMFDTNINYMIDCELWYRVFMECGAPGVIHNYPIVIGVGEHTLTSKLRQKENDMMLKDIAYCKEKFKL